MRLLRRLFAKLTQWSMLKSLDLENASQLEAAKWNHLQAIKVSKGKVKIDWYRIGLKPTLRCHRCKSVICIMKNVELVEKHQKNKPLCRDCMNGRK